VDEAIVDRDATLDAVGKKLAGAEQRVKEHDAELEAQEAELARRARRVAELEQISSRLAERVVERERELRQVREELELMRGRSDESVQTLAALAEDLETVRRQARGQATRIRLRALREAAELSEKVGEIARRPGEVGERLIDQLHEAIGRIGSEDDAALDELAATNGHAEREPGEMFEGLVEVDVGPLSDFSQLVGFEDAANGIGATSEISVKRFKEGRATVAMRFKHPVELLRELEERAPFEFKVRDARSDRVVLDVADE
jgi:hypothetical protein